MTLLRMTAGITVPERRMKILLVDDRPENLLALEGVLAPLRHELVKARSGTEALKYLLRDDFAVILLDVQMPGIDGFETARIIREREKSRSIPIIFLTAISKDQEHISVGYQLGAADYVTKPFNPEILKTKVSVFADLARQTDLAKRQAMLLEQRGVELEHANAELKKEISERMKAEAALARYAEELSSAKEVLEDLTKKREAALKKIEALYQKTRELDVIKSQFFANVSHELRTPLSLILGPLAQTMAEGSGFTLDQREWLRSIEQNARLLLKHVNDLLEVSKMEAGRLETQYVRFNLAELVRFTASHFEVLARERSIRFSTKAPAALPFEGDQDKVQRVVMNLLSNAFKFNSHAGAIECEVTSDDASAIITVADSGPGIPPEARQMVFERFRQLDSGAARAFGGTGLGLSIVKDFVDLHDGSIEIQDAPGGGALFRVTLPLSAPAGTQISKAPPFSSADDGDLAVAGFRSLVNVSATGVAGEGESVVLVVEDNLQMNDFIVRSLTPEHRVASAFDARTGLEKALELCPDLIVIDVMMPGTSGEELVREIREQRQLASVPIVILTAKADDALRVHLLRHGAQDYVVKPFATEELRARVSNLVSTKRIREILQKEVISQERDVVAIVKDLVHTRAELQKALAALASG